MNLKKIHLILFLKPCYKWIIIIKTSSPDSLITCFKPYYNWNTFNTVLTAKEIVNI